jgi:hypothetical protein
VKGPLVNPHTRSVLRFACAAFVFWAFAPADPAGTTSGRLPVFRDGDVVFQTSHSAQSVAIQRATGSAYSHMGLVLLRGGRPFVFEAISTVRFTPLAEWIARGNGGHFVARRLRDADTRFTPMGLARLRAEARLFEGRPYDPAFGWSDDRVYCSELVWKVYDRALGVQLGTLRKLREFNLADPVVAVKLRERYGSAIPLEEPVISPAAMFRSPLLVTVTER